MNSACHVLPGLLTSWILGKGQHNRVDERDAHTMEAIKFSAKRSGQAAAAAKAGNCCFSFYSPYQYLATTSIENNTIYVVLCGLYSFHAIPEKGVDDIYVVSSRSSSAMRAPSPLR